MILGGINICRDAVFGNVLEDDFEYNRNNSIFLWKLRTGEELECFRVDGRIIGCGNCDKKYIYGGCKARAYGYFRET
jgi:MoaA/NifB/PqqE/SkfB family radical SAM enzyme